MLMTREQRIANRYTKVKRVFGGLAPFWLTNDSYRLRDDSFFFNIVYQHRVHGCVNERIRYDTFNDVLYHLGQVRISQEAVLQMPEQDSYVFNDGATSTPNNPSNRL